MRHLLIASVLPPPDMCIFFVLFPGDMACGIVSACCLQAHEYPLFFLLFT